MFVLPINRDMDAANTPRAVIFLIITNSLLLAATYIFSSPHEVFLQYGFIPVQPHVRTLFTSMFIHAGFWHLAGNMWFLWMFGKEVENSMGVWLFTILYLLCGLGGCWLHFLFNPTENIPLGGASGAISGIVGIFFILFPKADFDLVLYLGWIRIKTFQSHTTAAVGVWIGEQALLGLLSQAVRFSSTAFWGHVGGFAVGVVAALCFKNLVPLDEENVPITRPWFIPDNAVVKESTEITNSICRVCNWHSLVHF
jgi:membrane associated rhomboid family serine protease